jgi:hypothetical protein
LEGVVKSLEVVGNCDEVVGKCGGVVEPFNHFTTLPNYFINLLHDFPVISTKVENFNKNVAQLEKYLEFTFP